MLNKARNMTIKLLFFGITQDLTANHLLQLELEQPITLSELKQLLFLKFPNLNRFPTFEMALNEQYVSAETMVNDRDIVALIPPVSGG